MFWNAGATDCLQSKSDTVVTAGCLGGGMSLLKEDLREFERNN